MAAGKRNGTQNVRNVGPSMEANIKSKEIASVLKSIVSGAHSRPSYSVTSFTSSRRRQGTRYSVNVSFITVSADNYLLWGYVMLLPWAAASQNSGISARHKSFGASLAYLFIGRVYGRRYVSPGRVASGREE